MFPLNVIAAARNLLATLTAGTNGTFTGFLDATFGTLIPVVLGGQVVAGIQSRDDTGSTTLLLERLGGNDVPDTDATFVSVNLTGTFVGGTNPRTVSLTRATASYIGNSGGFSQWIFTVVLNDRMIDTNVYDVEWVL